MNDRLARLLYLLLLAMPLAAQAPTLVTETPMSVFASSPLGTQITSRPAGILVTEPEQIQVEDGSGGSVFASTYVQPQGDSALFLESGGAAYRWGVQAVDAGTATASPQSDWHSWIWTLPGPRQGQLVGSFYATIQGASPMVGVAIDVDADGQDEFTMWGPNYSTFQIPIDRPAGVTVRIRTFGRVQSATMTGEYFSSSLEVAWVAAGAVPPARFLAGDFLLAPCGPELWMEDRPVQQTHNLEMKVRNAYASGTSVLLIGLQWALVPIPGTNCFLETVPLCAMPGLTDPSGRVEWSLAVPGPIPMGTAFVQAASLDVTGSTLGASNRIRVVFVD